jgi:hypothetical protein
LLSDSHHDLPPEAVALGGVRSEHMVGSSQYRQAIFTVVGLVLVNFATVFVVAYFPKDKPDWMTCVALASPGLVFLGLLAVYLWKRTRRALVLDGGLVVDHGHYAVAFPWDEIESVKEALLDVRYYGFSVRTDRLLDVRRRDGEQVKLNSHFRDIDALCEAIQSRVTDCLLPKAREALRQGRPVGFGPVRLTAQGFDDGGRHLLAWEDYEGATIKEGFLNVRRCGQKSDWFSRPLGEIANARVLLALLPREPGSRPVIE